MRILSSSAERAQSNVTKAEATVSEWQAKAATARTEAAALDATAGAAILADETAADSISLKVISLERKARAYDQAANEAGKQLNAARIAVLSLEADESDRAEVDAVKRYQKHEAAVKDLLDKLEALAGVKFVEAPEEAVSGPREVIESTAEQLEGVAHAHRANAAGIRYFLKTGTAEQNTVEINRVLGTNFPTGYINAPDSVATAIAAGLTVQSS
ncbi:hypothetical protein MB46_03445 [Arthrobacter alpinus]|uniref:hypothetical protein n=1 Tax=Arthrobacter alpinus TaxID=656366 RepID=UPI0005C99C1F|nr:hypothetical protein [Arthrobacter alpinus]ALV44706.1 hypothetical protein MB46_03445 [Arthrobacter alpinus]